MEIKVISKYKHTLKVVGVAKPRVLCEVDLKILVVNFDSISVLETVRRRKNPLDQIDH